MSTKRDREERRAERLQRNSEIAAMRESGATLEEIGRHFGVTRERVRQILKKADVSSAAEIRARRTAVVEAERRALAVAIRADVLAHPGSSPTEVGARLGIQRSEVTRLLPEDVASLVVHESRASGVKEWTDQAILDALRLAATYEFPLSGNAYGRLLELGEVSGPSRALIGKRFGSWTRACELAGVEPMRMPHEGYQSRWTDEDLLSFVHRYLTSPGSRGTYAGYVEWSRTVSEAPSGGSIRNRLGTWTEVKRQALGHPAPTEQESGQ